MKTKYKEYLVSQSYFKATGAEIHRLNNVVCAYQHACAIIENDDSVEIEDIAQKTEAILEKYIMSGTLEQMA